MMGEFDWRLVILIGDSRFGLAIRDFIWRLTNGDFDWRFLILCAFEVMVVMRKTRSRRLNARACSISQQAKRAVCKRTK